MSQRRRRIKTRVVEINEDGSIGVNLGDYEDAAYVICTPKGIEGILPNPEDEEAPVEGHIVFAGGLLALAATPAGQAIVDRFIEDSGEWKEVDSRPH